MKTIKTIFSMIVVMFTTLNLAAQVPWNTTGNAGTDTTNNFIGTSDSVGFVIKTFNQPRIVVNPLGTTTFTGKVVMKVDSFNVNGLAHIDSMKVSYYLHADSIRSRTLVVNNEPNSQAVNINGDVTINGTVKTDSIKLFRILPPDGDSIIKFGRSTINLDILHNRISWTPVAPWNIVRGLTIANGFSTAWGTNAMAFGNNALSMGISSMAFGNNVNAMRDYSFAIGNGVANWNANTFLLGFNSNTLFADATGVGINIVGHSSALDIAGDCNIRTVIQDDTLSQVLVRDQTHNGLIHWRDEATIGVPAGTAWLLSGNDYANSLISFNNNILGTHNVSINIRFWAGYNQTGYNDWQTGFWGLGSTTFTAQSLLHLNQASGVVNAQFTNNTIGNGATNGFLVGIDGAGDAILNQQYGSKPMLFFQNQLERMRIINSDIYTNLTTPPYPSSWLIRNINRVSVSEYDSPYNYVQYPKSLMHLGIDLPQGYATEGWRDWMDLGTLYSTGNQNLFLGFKPANTNTGTDPWPGDNDPVVSWGYNTQTSGYFYDNERLRFIYSTPPSTTSSGSRDGVELARMLYYDNSGNYEPRMGIGGDPLSATPKKYSAPLLDDPGNTLEINAVGAATDVGGHSGLRFTNLNNASTQPITPNQSRGVLSVNDAGDVIYVAASSGSTGATGPTGPSGADGATGPAGPSGIDGATGPSGIDGVTGATGPSGIDGATGPTGLDGTTGATGLDGATGATGLDGATGPTGPSGIDGVTGVTGPSGIDGSTGATGPDAADNGLSLSGPTAGIVHLGQSTNASGDPGKLLDNREIPLNDHDIWFKDPASPTAFDNNFYIGGLPYGSSKLGVFNNTNPFSMFITNEIPFNTTSIYGIESYVNNIGGASVVYGIESNAIGYTAQHNIAIYGIATTGVNTEGGEFAGAQGSGTNTGIWARAVGPTGLVTSNCAVQANAWSSGTGVAGSTYFGVYASAMGPVGTRNNAIYAHAPSNGYTGPTGFTGNPLVTQNSPNLAGNFNGDVFIGGFLNITSDKRLKINIDTLKSISSMDKIRALHPINFNFDTISYPSISLPRGPQLGFTAQEMQTVLPYIVRRITVPAQYDTTGTMIYDSLQIKTIAYEQLIPLAFAGIKELDSTTTSLDNRLDTFKIASANALTIGTNDTLELGGNLIKNTAIGFNNKNLVFTDPTSPTAGSNTLSLGENPSHKQWLAKLNVYDITDTTAATFINDSTSDTNLGIQVIAKRGATFNLGGSFEGSGSSSFNCGVAADANSNGKANAWNYGGDFQAYSAVTNNNINIGVVGQAGYGGSNIGGMFTAQSNDDYSYGIWASAQNSSNLNFTTAGFFNGDVVYTGSCYHYSDSALKENVAPLNNAMELISKINPKTYNFKTKQYPDLNFPKSKEYGLLAQELSRVMPELTETIVSPEIRDAHGKTVSASQSYTGINYIELIPVLIAGMKEQQQSIIGQQQAITGQQKQIDSLITIVQSMQHSKPGATEKTTGNNDNGNEKNNYQVVELASENSIVLNQNDPNPFAEETDITYFLPEKISNAKIMFYDITGKIIKSVELIGTGNGTLHVYASNLSSGTYMYSLIADGKTIDSKKMVCTNK